MFTLVVVPVFLGGCNGNRISHPKDASTLSITLARDSYEVTIHGTGSVEYEGGPGVPARGRRASSLPPERIAAILEAMDRAHFMSIDDQKFPEGSDIGYVSISLSLDGQNKKVRSLDWPGDYPLPLRVFLFDRVAREQRRFQKLADELDSLIGTERWTKCSPKCMLLVRRPDYLVDNRGSDGSTILLAIIESKKDMSFGAMDIDARTIIEAGVDVNAPNDEGLTALMAAAKNDDADLVRDLLAHGADPNAIDKHGMTARSYAKKPEIRALFPADVSGR